MTGEKQPPGGPPASTEEGRVRQSLRRAHETGFDPVDLAGSAWGAVVASWRRVPQPLRRPVEVVTRTFGAYSSDRGNIYAAAIAYYALFSVIPLLIVTLALLGFFVSEDRVVEFIYDQFPLEESADVADTVSAIVRRTKNLSGPALVFGSIALAWSASGVFAAMRQGLNAVGHRGRGQNYFVGKAIDVALVPLMGALIFIGLFANAGTQAAMEELARWDTLSGYRDTVWRTASMAVTGAISFGFFLVLYRFVPSNRPPWRQAVLAAVLATILFAILRSVVSVVLSVTSFSGDAALYASLATALGFLYVMRIIGSVLLLGAVFARVVLGDTREAKSEVPPPALET